MPLFSLRWPGFSRVSLEQPTTLNSLETYQYNSEVRNAFRSLSSPTLLKALTEINDFLDNIGIGLSGSTIDTIKDNLPYLAGLLANAVGETDLDWPKFVDRFVYGYPNFLGNLSSVNLNSPRLPWAATKDLAFALGVNADPSVLLDRGWSFSEPSTWLTPYEKNFSALTPSDQSDQSWWKQYSTAVGENPAALPLLVVSDWNPANTITGYAEFPFGPASLNFKKPQHLDR